MPAGARHNEVETRCVSAVYFDFRHVPKQTAICEDDKNNNEITTDNNNKSKELGFIDEAMATGSALHF